MANKQNPTLVDELLAADPEDAFSIAERHEKRWLAERAEVLAALDDALVNARKSTTELGQRVRNYRRTMELAIRTQEMAYNNERRKWEEARTKLLAESKHVEPADAKDGPVDAVILDALRGIERLDTHEVPVEDGLDLDCVSREDVLDVIRSIRPALLRAIKPAEAKEPTRAERLVRCALDLKALGADPYVDGGDYLDVRSAVEATATEAAVVREALGEGADGS